MRNTAARAKSRPKREKVAPEWPALLQEALNAPGKMNEAYRLYHNFSLGNSIWLLCQLAQRGIEPGPAASYGHWQKLGRQVRKGEQAFWLYMPVIIGGKKKPAKPIAVETGKTEFASRPEESGEGTAERQPIGQRKRIYIARPNWFVLAQTEPMEGVEQKAPETDSVDAAEIQFSVAQAAEALGITVTRFADVNGNTQGYAWPSQKQIAISPVAADPIKTSIHEMAHCLLHGDVDAFSDGVTPDGGLKEVEAEGTAYIVCATLGHAENLPSMRAYIQGWLARSGQAFQPQNAKRIFTAANMILRAGELKSDAEAAS